MIKMDALLIAGYDPLNMLHDVGRLDLLLTLDVPIVLTDVVFEAHAEAAHVDERSWALKNFIDQNSDHISIIKTAYGQDGEERKRLGQDTDRPIAMMALTDFMRGDVGQGVDSFLTVGRTLHLLFSDEEFQRIAQWQSHRVFCITISQLLAHFESEGLIDSAAELLKGMQVRTNMMRALDRYTFVHRSV